MVDFQNVTKRYGSTAAIDNISMKMADSSIYCLLGRNGAGKTTFMKLLAGHIRATEGRIVVDGHAVSPGHMPESVNFVENSSAQFNAKTADLIDMAASLQDHFDKPFALEMVKKFD